MKLMKLSNVCIVAVSILLFGYGYSQIRTMKAELRQAPKRLIRKKLPQVIAVKDWGEVYDEVMADPNTPKPEAVTDKAVKSPCRKWSHREAPYHYHSETSTRPTGQYKPSCPHVRIKNRYCMDCLRPVKIDLVPYAEAVRMYFLRD